MRERGRFEGLEGAREKDVSHRAAFAFEVCQMRRTDYTERFESHALSLADLFTNPTS